MSMQWYAVRVAPGSQRMAKPLAIAETATERDKAEVERRKGETLIERQLRQEGIDVYMPAFWKEIRAHRGRRLRARRLPLLVGYVFIRYEPGKGFSFLKEIDGAAGVVSINQAPAAMAEADIRFLMLQMFEHHQAFLFQKAQNIEDARFKRRQTLNAELGRHLPKGRARTVSLRVYANACIASLPPGARERVQGIVSAIDALECDSSLDAFREAV